jgi:hypothetical protein
MGLILVDIFISSLIPCSERCASLPCQIWSAGSETEQAAHAADRRVESRSWSKKYRPPRCVAVIRSSFPDQTAAKSDQQATQQAHNGMGLPMEAVVTEEDNELEGEILDEIEWI